MSRPQIKMVGVTQNDLGSELHQLLLRDCLNGSGRANRHEDRSLNFAVIGDDLSQSCLRPAIPVRDSKFQGVHPVSFRERFVVTTSAIPRLATSSVRSLEFRRYCPRLTFPKSISA